MDDDVRDFGDDAEMALDDDLDADGLPIKKPVIDNEGLGEEEESEEESAGDEKVV